MVEEIGRRQKSFSAVFCWNGGSISNFEVDGRTFAASLAQVSGNYFQVVQTVPLLGRFIRPSDMAAGVGTSDALAVISYRVWRSWFNSDPLVVGRTIRVDGKPYTAIGVEPEGFSGLNIDSGADVTIPLFSPGKSMERGLHVVRFALFGRLLPGVTPAQAREGLEVLWPQVLAVTKPQEYEGERQTRFLGRKIKLEPAANGVSFLRKRFSYSLLILLALVGSALLMACLNLASLSLAKAAARRHKSGVRAALGATVWDLVRQPLIESVLLSGLGASLGLGMAYGTSAALLQIANTGYFTTALSTAPDWRVLIFTAVVAVLTSLVFGTLPAWFAARTDPLEALGQQTRSVRGGTVQIRNALLTVQMALAVVLMVGALLLGQTLRQLHTVDVGYQRDHLLTSVLFPQAGRSLEQNRAAYYRELAGKVQGLPGVSGVSYSQEGPANEYEYLSGVYRSPGVGAVQAVNEVVGPDFFAVMGMRVLQGREFTWRDNANTPDAAILSRKLAEHLFGQQNAVGRAVYLGPPGHLFRLMVVGVVSDASLWKVESGRPSAIYRNFLQRTGDEPLLDVRTTVEPGSLKAPVERVIRSMGHHYSLRTMSAEERLDSYITVQRLTAVLAIVFGGMALLMAAIGLYGLMLFQVTRRTAELGIRVALGAQRWQVMALVVREGLAVALVSCLLGIAACLLCGRFVTSLLFGISPHSVPVMGLVVVVLLITAIAAAFVPAKRAADLDPTMALRTE